eukprot:CAMPEP_0114988308 /NCGR_PEP_ID=MMETSP0216-20121206/9523_1 /TAXON_ID=223996 /ORGANISM="Protocruzia adherens, Strain Boccale" /LENGTH=483 /DNA_ID=CAMNT_0002351067 /DNA_START=132 /DNA_END=1583 /DNA_ORIENTATION=-
MSDRLMTLEDVQLVVEASKKRKSILLLTLVTLAFLGSLSIPFLMPKLATREETIASSIEPFDKKFNLSIMNQSFSVSLVAQRLPPGEDGEDPEQFVETLVSFEIQLRTEDNPHLAEDYFVNEAITKRFSFPSSSDLSSVETTILYLEEIEHDLYHLIISFPKESTEGDDLVHNYKVITYYLNEETTRFQIVVSCLYVFLGGAVLVYFEVALIRFPFKKRLYEQRYLTVLLILFILMTNPTRLLHIFYHSFWFALLNAVLVSLFICALFLFWLTNFHRLSKRKFDPFSSSGTLNGPKIAFMALMFIYTVIIYTYYYLEFRSDPAFQGQDSIPQLQMVSLTLFATYMVWTFIYALFAENRISELSPPLRYKFLMWFTAFIVLVSIFTLIIQLAFFYVFDGTILLTFYSIFFFYLCICAISYSPANAVLVAPSRQSEDFSSPVDINEPDGIVPTDSVLIQGHDSSMITDNSMIELNPARREIIEEE